MGGVDRSLVREHMRELLTEEATLLARLENLLEREASALRDDDLPTIESVGAERHGCVESLMRIDGERRATCTMMGLGDDRRRFAELLDQCDPGGELKSRWLAGLQVAARCKDRNERNGAVVTAKLRRVEGLLASIRGGAAPVYQASGARQAASRGMELARV